MTMEDIVVVEVRVQAEPAHLYAQSGYADDNAGDNPLTLLSMDIGRMNRRSKESPPPLPIDNTSRVQICCRVDP